MGGERSMGSINGSKVASVTLVLLVYTVLLKCRPWTHCEAAKLQYLFALLLKLSSIFLLRMAPETG